MWFKVVIYEATTNRWSFVLVINAESFNMRYRGKLWSVKKTTSMWFKNAQFYCNGFTSYFLKQLIKPANPSSQKTINGRTGIEFYKHKEKTIFSSMILKYTSINIPVVQLY